MKNIFKKQYVILIILAIILGVGIVRTGVRKPVNPCYDVPGCIPTTEMGAMHTKTRGYPLAIQQTKTFKPTNTNRYAESSVETQRFSVPSALVNVLFWFALLDVCWRLVVGLKALATNKK